MSKIDDDLTITEAELKQLRQDSEELKKLKEEKNVKTEKPKEKAWRCAACGAHLGPADWEPQRLTRAHPDGCPRCGSTKADIA